MMLRFCVTTLFPYTTLFRSVDGCVACERVVRDSRRPCREDEQAGDEWDDERELAGAEVERLVVDERAARVMQDRKSTRLNSSHTVISYAVFCLKKKNQIKTL